MQQRWRLTDRWISSTGNILLKLACNFPLRMVNGSYLYKVIPKACHDASLSPTTNSRTTSAAVILHPQTFRMNPLLWRFISVFLRHGHPVVFYFSFPSSCFCLPSTQSPLLYVIPQPSSLTPPWPPDPLCFCETPLWQMQHKPGLCCLAKCF